MMNVAIVGNSNCVFRDGFSRGVERAATMKGGRVMNYSLGGSCCALHLYTLHDRYDELVTADLVVLDSLVIDTFHWRRKIIQAEELFGLIDDMYALYAALPGRVVSVLFPIKKYLGAYESLPTYKAHMAAAKKYGIDVVNLYKVLDECGGDKEAHFMQPSHLKTDISHEIGIRLIQACEKIPARKKPYCVDSPYQVIKKEAFARLKPLTVKSSLFNARCYQLDREVSLGSFEGRHLVGAMHWNKSCRSSVVFSGGDTKDVVALRSKYAFFEVLNEKRKLDKNFAIRPAEAGEESTQQAAGKVRESEYGLPQLIGLLVRNESCVSVKNVGRHKDLSHVVSDVFR